MSLVNDLSFKVRSKNISIIKIKIDYNIHLHLLISTLNEILVDQFLQKNIRFPDINKIIMTVLKDRNYRKYAIRKPINIKVIQLINDWAKTNLKKYVKTN